MPPVSSPASSVTSASSSSSRKRPAPAPAAGEAEKNKRVYTPEQHFRARLRRVWARQAVDHGRLLAAYQRAFGTKKNGPDLLFDLVVATSRPGAQPIKTDVRQITRFVVQLSEDIPPAQLLTWSDDDGSVVDVRLALSDSAGQIAAATKFLLDGAKNRLNQSVGDDGSGSRHHLRQLWVERRKSGGLDDVLQAWQKLPGNDLRAEFHVLEYLHGLTLDEAARKMPVDSDAIERFVVEVPGLDRPLDLLRRLNDDNTLADLRVVPEQKERVPWLVRLMERGQENVLARKSAPKKQAPRNADSLWGGVKNELGGQFEAFKASRRRKNERIPAAGAFVKHLDALCLAAGEGVPVDGGDGSIRRFVVTPEGSDAPVTLLRRADERGLAGLRAIGPGAASEEAALKSMLHYTRHAASAPAAMAEPATTGVAVSATFAAPATAPATAPAGRKSLNDAWQLKQALEVAVANRGRSGDLLAGAAKAAGVPDKELRRWIDWDGSFLLMPSAMLKLKGYFDVREDLETLFLDLGQPASAAKLPEDLTGELMLRMVQARIEDRGANTTKLARIAGAHPEVAKRYFDVSHVTFLKASNDTLRRLPDYAEHHDALVAALTELGHTERANRLPAPETGAETFLRELQERLYQVKMAVAQMRRDPSLSPAQAVRRVNAWPEMPALLARLVGPGGTLRGAAEIARDLPGFEPGLQPLLQALLGRLDTPIDGGAGEMTEELLPAKGLAPGKVFIVRDPSGAHDGRVGLREGKAVRGRRLEQIYANSPELIMRPRSYRAERQKQSLRWVSTVLKGLFPKATEVQAYWDAQRGELWVSSNNTGANADIQKFLSSGGLARHLEELAEDTHASRETRHASRLRKMMLDPSARPAQAEALLNELFNGKVHVPTDMLFSTASGHRIELHAERRIKLAFEKRHGEGTMDRRAIAGTMRPCGICAKDLGLPATARRGPYWMSRAGSEGHDIFAATDEARAASIGTYATLTRADELTIAYNTDSGDSVDDASDDDATLASMLAGRR